MILSTTVVSSIPDLADGEEVNSNLKCNDFKSHDSPDTAIVHVIGYSLYLFILTDAMAWSHLIE